MTAPITTIQALLVALGIIGCTTALAITGHIAGSDALATYALIAGGTLGVAGAHVGATAATNAANNAASAPDTLTTPTPGTVPPVASVAATRSVG